MMEDQTILMTKKDSLRIHNILNEIYNHELEELDLELSRAKILEDDKVPADLVTMNSKFSFESLDDNKESIITLVYPGDANSKEGKISILAPLGSALIGLRVGEIINWKFPNNEIKRLKINKILYQPEANGDWNL